VGPVSLLDMWDPSQTDEGGHVIWFAAAALGVAAFILLRRGTVGERKRRTRAVSDALGLRPPDAPRFPRFP